MQLDDPFRDGKTETGSTLGPRAGAVELPEFLEHQLLILKRNSWAGIGDRNLERTVRCGDVNGDFPGLGEFDRISDQVQQHLRDPPLVAFASGQIVCNGSSERQVLFRDQRLGSRR